ncbi:hypothetical protein K439DRAFT_585877 [Ramaria rubella]|nr:hypothetical protein K439DRAFT_585877 [Ramaria rubella]
MVTTPYRATSTPEAISEDFLSLRDPFMSPPPVSPINTILPAYISRPSSQRSSADILLNSSTLSNAPKKHKSTPSLPLLYNIQSPGRLDSISKALSPTTRSVLCRTNSELVAPLQRSYPTQPRNPDPGDKDPLNDVLLSRIIVYPKEGCSVSSVSTVRAESCDRSPSSVESILHNPNIALRGLGISLNKRSSNTMCASETSRIEGEEDGNDRALASMESETGSLGECNVISQTMFGTPSIAKPMA